MSKQIKVLEYDVTAVEDICPEIPEEERYDPSPPGERRLWQSVIIQALLDATRPNAARTETLIETQRAQSWFETQSSVTASNFSYVCDKAGFHPTTVRKFYFKLKKSGRRATRRNLLYLWHRIDKE